jgi:hypothetical protein
MSRRVSVVRDRSGHVVHHPRWEELLEDRQHMIRAKTDAPTLDEIRYMQYRAKLEKQKKQRAFSQWKARRTTIPIPELFF